MSRMLKYFFFYFLTWITSGREADDISSYCTQTSRYRLDATPWKIVPLRINETSRFHQPDEAVVKEIHLTLCPDVRFIKLSWIISDHKAANLTVCYATHSAHEEIGCFIIQIQDLEGEFMLDCWFPSYYHDDIDKISAWAVSTDRQPDHYFYGEINTKHVDTDHSCPDACETSELTIYRPVYCHVTSLISYDPGVAVHRVAFDPDETNNCGNHLLEIESQTENRTEYRLNCIYQGEGHVKVLFAVKGRYCIKYQSVAVLCAEAADREQQQQKIDDAHSFGAFMIFALVCVVVIAVLITATIIVTQRLIEPCQKHCKPQLRQCCHGKEAFTVEESIPLQVKIGQESSAPQQSAENVTPNSRSKANKQRFENDQCSQDTWEAWRQAYLKRMRRSITMALLEDIDPLYKKRILFLPIPFDHYSRDTTFLLKRVFTKDAGIISQCCFDRDVYSKYMTGDRYRATETILGDHDKILVFLCFTSLTNDVKHDVMVRNILENLLKSRVKSHRLCKVYFLHLVDNPENIHELHYGEHFHIGCETDYFEFINSILSYCCRHSEDNSVLKQRVSTCRHSKQFLHLIGVDEKIS